MKIKIILASSLVSLIFVGCSKTNAPVENTVVAPEPNTTAQNQVETDAYKEPVANQEQQVETNIYQLNQEMDNPELANSISGFLVYKTKDCKFNPLYSSITTCDPDTGYVILSDSKAGLEEDPSVNKTTLKENQVLIFYVPDSIIDRLEMRKAYNFRGTASKYGDFTSMKYSGLNDMLDCKKLENEIVALYEKANYCENDSDCFYRPSVAFESGCDRTYNKDADLIGAYVKEKLFFDYRCESPEVTCAPPDSIDLKCIDKKCNIVKK